MSTLSLTPIDGGHWRVRLSVREDQRHYVSDTAFDAELPEDEEEE